ncbi:MAG: TonB-dependent receptor [Candidatus Omnitrophota bacterium]|nr:TonB-dependent receptor [Candidatus Omnitrophota bacterium]
MKKVTFWVLSALLLTKPLFAAYDEAVDLDKIVVTPYRYEEALENTAASVTVITAQAIADSNAKTTADLLRTIPGVMVRDWYGNGTKAAVDIGGFGEQAALNVLVLIDGRRVNNVDLSGVDWSQVPLDRVEKIEVIRGGAGGVLYGDNATSGVINIITKKGEGKPEIKLKTVVGSYALDAEKLSLSGSIDNKFSYWLYGGHEATNGYRKNSYVKSKDFASNLEYAFNDSLSVHLNSGYYYSAYGMPASLWQQYIDQHGRRFAKHGEDHANNLDYFYVLGTKVGLADFGGLEMDFSFRRNDTDSYFPNSKLNTQINKIDTIGITPKYTLKKSILEHDNKLIAGLDYSRAYFRSDKYNRLDDGDPKNFTRTNKTSLAGYLQDEFFIFEKLILVGGYRHEQARYAFNYHDFSGWNPDIDQKLRPEEKIYNGGLVYNYQKDSSIFLNAGKSFRFPEVDEFTYNDASWQQQLNTNLRPQTSMNYQLGARHKFSPRLKAGFSLFRMNVKDEIYYNSTGGPLGQGQNENYDKTVHQGAEVSFETKLRDWIDLSGNYAFTDAYFNGGVYGKNEIPLVPRHKVSIGLKFILPRDLAFNIAGNYVGKRYFLNDQANTYSRLNGYAVLDTNLIWNHKNLTVSFGVNNLLNRKYSEYAGVVIQETWESSTGIYWPAGSKFYYPSPERNFNLKAEYKF